MTTKMLVAPFLLLSVLSLPAQEKQPSRLVQTGTRLFKSLTEPSKSTDGAYVLRPRLKWTVSADVNSIHTGADLHSDITVSDFRGDNASIINGTMDLGMSNRLYTKAGFGISYAGLGIGYGIEIGKKSGERNTFFTFGSITSFYGYNIKYYRTHQNVSGTLALEGYDPIDLTSKYPGEMRNLSLSGFYAFNRRKFVFASAYGGRTLQRRSAGSWVVTAKYTQGAFSVDPNDVFFTERLNDLHRYSTQQFSLGGGYAFNWVLFHRDPSDRKKGEGLRNLTLNATFLPMISLLNHVKTEQGNGNDRQVVRYVGQPSLSPAFLGAVCYSWDRYFITAQAGYNDFRFQGTETGVEEDGGRLRTKIRTHGVFYDMSAKIQVGVRF